MARFGAPGPGAGLNELNSAILRYLVQNGRTSSDLMGEASELAALEAQRRISHSKEQERIAAITRRLTIGCRASR